MTAPASATGVILTEAAAAKAKALLDQEAATISPSALPFSLVAALACATSFTLMIAPWMVTRSTR